MKITACRICFNTNLIPIGSLGDIAISNFTTKPEEGKKYPLELVYCEKCTLLQLSYTTPRDLLYKNYWYQSHINPVIVNDLKEIAGLCKGTILIDIGGNDGTLLRNAQDVHIRINVDPSNIYPEGDINWIREYWEDVNLPYEADTITAVACLYDLPDPNKFVKNVKKHLAKDGIFIVQLMTLAPMIENNDIGNICHEHLEYYSYKSLITLFEQNGLEVFSVDENNINGGSYRLFIQHYQKGSIKHIEKEFTANQLSQFFARIEKNKKDFLTFLQGNRGKILGYGASTKGNTILQYYGLTRKDIPAIVDINPEKKGKFTAASLIPVIDRIPSDTKYLWVLPWGFLDYFKKREKDFFSRGGSFIVSTPTFNIVYS